MTSTIKNSHIPLIWWKSAAQLLVLGITFICVREIAVTMIFYDVFLSFDWAAYAEYFIRKRLFTIILLIFSIPLVTRLIFANFFSQVRRINGKNQISESEQAYFTRRINQIKWALTGYFFGGSLIGLLRYVINGLGTNSLLQENALLYFSPFGFSVILLLFFCSLLTLLLDSNFKELRVLLNFNLMGERKRQRQSRLIGITMFLSFIFISWLLIYYGFTVIHVKTTIINELSSALEKAPQDRPSLSNVYRILRLTLSEYAEKLAYYNAFDARKMKLDHYVMPRNLSDYFVFIPILTISILGFLTYLLTNAKLYNEALSTISQHVRSLLRKETGIKEQIVLQRFDDIGYLTGYLNLLFRIIHRSLEAIHLGALEVNRQMNDATQQVQKKTQLIYQLNTTFAQSGTRIEQQIQRTNDTQYSLKTLNSIVGQIKNEVARQNQELVSAETTVGNFNQTVGEVQQQLQEANHNIHFLGELAISGQQTVSKSFTMVLQLASISHRIRDIVNVIGRISAQTGLLSMNAAIEAAHASEHSSGFAVVSSSIRQLSEDSNSQNKAIRVQIKEMINRVVSALELSKTALASLRGVQHGVQRSRWLLDTTSRALDNQRQETVKLAQQIALLSGVTGQILEDVGAQMINLKQLNSGTAQLGNVVENLYEQSNLQLQQSDAVMSAFEKLRSGVDSGLDETQQLREAADRLRLV